MTDDRSLARTLERAARSWIEVGPTAAPPHVVDEALALIDHTPQERDWFPWRLPHMTSSARVAALVAIGALILAGAFALLGPGSSGLTPPSPAPSAHSSAAVAPSPPSATVTPPANGLSQTFTSEVYGYSVGFPAGWQAYTAERLWVAGDTNLWNSGYNDALSDLAGKRFSGASQRLATGQTPESWLAAHASGADVASWPTILIDGRKGYVSADALRAFGGTMARGARFIDAVVVVGDRAYNFNMDGKVDRATFDAFLATIKLDPTSPGLLPALDATFVSPWYGYRIPIASTWTTKAATAHWHGVDNSAPAIDLITITGSDTIVQVASQALAKGTSFDEWLVQFHQFTLANVPAGCDGGDPATWPQLRIGHQLGRLQINCNFAEAVVEVAGRVYVFDWANTTFDASQHLGQTSWKKLLESVTFEPTKAVDR
jgi:hypothetical protein